MNHVQNHVWGAKFVEVVKTLPCFLRNYRNSKSTILLWIYQQMRFYLSIKVTQTSALQSHTIDSSNKGLLPHFLVNAITQNIRWLNLGTYPRSTTLYQKVVLRNVILLRTIDTSWIDTFQSKFWNWMIRRPLMHSTLVTAAFWRALAGVLNKVFI